MRVCQITDCGKKHDSHGYCPNHAQQYLRWGRIRSKAEVSAEKAERNIRIKPNLGHKWSDEKKKAQSELFKGRCLNSGRTHFKKGDKSWNAGISDWQTPEHKEAVRLACTKYSESEKISNKIMRMRSRKLRNLVMARDDYACQVCLRPSEYLQVDHIKPWAQYPELRLELSNLRTLCMPCHFYITYKRKIPEGMFWGHRRTT